jgi:hypothetical protein
LLALQVASYARGDGRSLVVLRTYLKKLAGGLGKGQAGGAGSAVEFDSVKATKAMRAAEKLAEAAVPWAELPAMVRFEVSLRLGVTSDEGFYALRWRPRQEGAKEPHSPLCWYRSVYGIAGGPLPPPPQPLVRPPCLPLS